MKHVTCGLLLMAAMGCGSDAPEDGRDVGPGSPWPTGGSTASATGGFGGLGGFGGPGAGFGGPGAGFGGPGAGFGGPGAGGTAGPMGGVPEDVCAQIEVEPIIIREPGNLLVIFDRSQSMGGPFIGGGGARIEVVNDALLQALEPFVCEETGVDQRPCQESLNVGAILFPSGAAELFADPLCPAVDTITASTQIDWQSATEFVQSWAAYWAQGSPNAILPLGTPITRAFEQGENALQTSNLTGKTAVLFLTDGETTCTMPVGGVDPLVVGTEPADQAAAWLTRDIHTYVVSVAETATAFNDAVAVAGGTTESINPTEVTQLTDALSTIVNETIDVVECLVDLDGKTITNQELACEMGEVFVGPTKIPCDPVNGFQIRDDGQLELLGNACTQLTEARQDLSAQFPCELILE